MLQSVCSTFVLPFPRFSVSIKRQSEREVTSRRTIAQEKAEEQEEKPKAKEAVKATGRAATKTYPQGSSKRKRSGEYAETRWRPAGTRRIMPLTMQQ